jgi:hypothetical protein
MTEDGTTAAPTESVECKTATLLSAIEKSKPESQKELEFTVTIPEKVSYRADASIETRAAEGFDIGHASRKSSAFNAGYRPNGGRARLREYHCRISGLLRSESMARLRGGSTVDPSDTKGKRCESEFCLLEESRK